MNARGRPGNRPGQRPALQLIRPRVRIVQRQHALGVQARKRATGAGRKERVAGKVMQWEGEATGDPLRKAEGKALAAYGRLKGAAHKARKRSK